VVQVKEGGCARHLLEVLAGKSGKEGGRKGCVPIPYGLIEKERAGLNWQQRTGTFSKQWN